ncbi:MAG: sulfatase-like hydrolase/transferase [Deltaproteobacteria bacterium]|nr:sulfatase-like hydrolase/transferase [Deltaproteobacteria bacterium]
MRSNVPSLARLGLAGLGVASIGLAPGTSRAQERPNVVLVVADDLGYAELGSYGQRQIRTPALDRLASRGVRFDQAYSSAPVCAPSRCSILTGLHAGHCVVFENDEPNIPLASRDPTIAEMLALAGYRGAVVGKWALGGELDDGTPWNVQSAPWRVGFADVLAVLDQEIAQAQYPQWMWAAGEGVEPSLRVLGDGEGPGPEYAPDLYASRAVELVRDAPEPFFLYVPTTLPHRELVPPPGSGVDANDPDATYAAMVERLDAHVGAILDAIEARGIAERTYVVFTSDNGPNAIDGHRLETFASTGGLRGQKRDLYEGGVRVPLLVAGPGVAVRVEAEPVMLADLFPTFTGLAGAPTPEGLDGRSLVSLLRGPSDDERPLHEHLYFECNERRGGAEAPTRQAVRRGRWKWVRRGDRGELYDLENDPGETTDLATREPAIASELAALAAEEHATRPLAREPVLRVRANDEESPRPLRETGPTPLLLLHPDDVDDDGIAWPQRIEEPRVVATIVGPEVVRGDPGHLRFDGDDRVVVPSHPALAVLGRSFSLRARLRVGALAEGPDRDARQWLVFAKPTGLHDVHASFGLLVQGGDLGCAPEAPHDCDGREIVVFFGDPRLDPARPLAIGSTLRIEDDAIHDLRVHVDRVEGVIEIVLDDRRESIPFLVSPGIDAEAPIVIGAHHDAAGRFSQGLRGELYRLSIAEGRASDAQLTQLGRIGATRHVHVRLGEIARDSGAAVELALHSVLPDAHWMRVEVALDGRVRARLEGDPIAALFGGDETRRRVILDTSREGRYAADLTVRATRGRTGTLVEGAPVRVHIRARVVAPSLAAVPSGPSADAQLARGLGAGLAVVSLVVIAIAMRRRRA